MQVSVESTSSIERELTITVPAARIEDDVNTRLKEAAGNVRLDGFRPGKVPFKVVKRRYGQGIRQEVLGEVIQNTFYEAVTQEKLKPAGGPEIEPKSDKEGEDFQYVARFEVYPEIELVDYSPAEITKQTAEVTDADVDNMVESLQKQQSNWTETDAAVADGDQVNIDFKGFVDGEAFDGGEAQGHDQVIGSNTMIPGFEEGIIGMKAGEEKDINVTFPEDYNSEALAGKDAVFNIKVNKVSNPDLPELNAELFAQFGVKVETVEEFKAEIRKNMEREVKQQIKVKTKGQAFDALVELNDIEIPKALIDGEVDRLREQAVQQFGQGLELDPKTLPAELFADQAKKRVATGLLVTAVIESNEIKVDDERVQEFIAEMAASYEDPNEFINYYNSNEEQLQQVEAVVLEDQAMELLLSQAKVSEEQVSYEEAVKPAQQPEPEDETEAEA